MNKKQALAKFLEFTTDDQLDSIEESRYQDNLFEVDGDEYLVLTDDEADEAAKEHILDSLWAFNADFIASHANANLDKGAIEALQEMQGKLCESANPIVKAMIKDIDHFVDDAINCDGRGHFLSPYDGEENESGEYFIYRIN